jgi:hypothetical protein
LGRWNQVSRYTGRFESFGIESSVQLSSASQATTDGTAENQQGKRAREQRRDSSLFFDEAQNQITSLLLDKDIPFPEVGKACLGFNRTSSRMPLIRPIGRRILTAPNVKMLA